MRCDKSFGVLFYLLIDQFQYRYPTSKTGAICRIGYLMSITEEIIASEIVG